jgi:hypothetical protein
LSQIAKTCNQKEIYLAVSNPAIELWFLLLSLAFQPPIEQKCSIGGFKL